MNAIAVGSAAVLPRPLARTPQLVLLGTGTVGSAFVQRYARVRTRAALPSLALIANSRASRACADDPATALRMLVCAAPSVPEQGVDDVSAGDVVIDATSSDAVASRHATWLRRGVHVVTANKLGNGESLERARAIAQAQRIGGGRYGDAATVGAGLPLLRSIRELVRGGDRIHGVEGILSGSMAWLFDRYDGMRPFSGFVREARAAGYTEPDPRADLSGDDVRRKVLILARAAGFPLDAAQVQVDSLVPAALAIARDPDQVDALLSTLDAPIRARYQQAYRDGACLRFVGRFCVSSQGHAQASVGLLALPHTHPLCSGGGTDNRVAIRSDRYRDQPLVIQGPGAGAEVTAAALLDDVLRIVGADASNAAG